MLNPYEHMQQIFKHIQSLSLRQKYIISGFVFFSLLAIFFITHASHILNQKKTVFAAHIVVAPLTPIVSISPTPVTVLQAIQIAHIPTTNPTRIPPIPTIQTSSQNTSAAHPTASTTNTQSSYTAPTAQPSPTPTVMQISSTSTPTPIISSQDVTIQITEPDGTFTFQVDLHNGNTVCDILQTAKSEGKIKSLTFDSSYMSSLHSLYIKEMNGFSDNWTFTVNGSSPLGCSLINPKPNDSIEWKFG